MNTVNLLDTAKINTATDEELKDFLRGIMNTPFATQTHETQDCYYVVCKTLVSRGHGINAIFNTLGDYTVADVIAHVSA